MQNMRLLVLVVSVLLLLMLPLVAMQFTDEVNWSIFDFVAMGTFLLSLSIVSELILKFAKNTPAKLLLIGIAILFFVLIWIELAVGIFNSPFKGS
jgi:hypothetical protein